ncbi:MAG: energy-coupling factor transporter transmembrane protein EcfT [Gaiellales bacterium]|nr:energy-coupling factor transporter transmembrane protein EcfT [Gaiellales bacterium]
MSRLLYPAAGQYLAMPSLFHSLDPRVKLAGSVLFVGGLFAAGGWRGLALLGLGMVAQTAVARVPLVYLWRSTRPFLILLAFTWLVQAVTLPGEAIGRWGPFVVTREGVGEGAFLAARLGLLVLSGTALLTATSPVALTDALSWYLAPLGRVGVPVWDLAIVLSLALRFVPTLMLEVDRLIRAQQGRGIQMTARHPLRLLRAVLPLVVPLFVLSFRQADVLANAMVSRCYRGGRGRTRYRQMRFQGRDALAAVAFVLLVGLAVGLGRGWVP